jgi:hypothetical protein
MITAPISTSSSWLRKSTTASVTLMPVDSFAPRTFDGRRQADHDDGGDDVARARPEPLGELEHATDVVRHEERRDRDRDGVGEHPGPGREERPELVDRAPGEARGAARLGEHRSRLGVAGGGAEEEEEPRDDEDDRGQAQRA